MRPQTANELDRAHGDLSRLLSTLRRGASLTTKTTTIRKDVNSAFVLDKTKLTRLLDVIEQRYEDLNDNISQRFDVTLKNKQVITVRSADELFNLDNSIKNPITTLDIVGSKANSDDLVCKVSFSSYHGSNIMMYINTRDNQHTSRFFAEVEEQVERAFTKYWIHRINVGNSLATKTSGKSLSLIPT